MQPPPQFLPHPTRILFVWAGAAWAIHDVARGYRDALARQGHDIRDFRLYNRLAFAAQGLKGKGPKGMADGHLTIVSRLASETLLAEAAYHDAELVVIVSGLALHPNGLWLLRQWKKQVPVALILTESPYEDEDQKGLASYCDVIFTTERTSARQHGWHYLRHAYDPYRHRRWRADPTKAADVFIVGTGWEERVVMLQKVDWKGIGLRIQGYWPIKPGDPLGPYYKHGVVENKEVSHIYASSRICLNAYRQTAVIAGGRQVTVLAEPAESLNPRAYEIAACGGFQLSDHRAELVDVFEDTVPIYEGPEQLGELCRYYLTHHAERRRLANLQHRRVKGNTFDQRAVQLMDAIRRTV